jgi:hypothetical protein
MRRTTIFLVLTTLIATQGVADAPPEMPLLNRLPKDPLAVWATQTGNGADALDQLLATVQRFAPDTDDEQITKAMADLDAELGFSVRDDLLAHLGPGVAFTFDMTPVDYAAGVFMSGAPTSLAQVFANVGLCVGADDADAVNRALTALAHKAELETERRDDGLVHAWLPRPEAASADGASETGPAAPEIHLYWAIRDGVLAMGLAPEAVTALVTKRPKDEALASGTDYAKVRSHLEPGATSLMYVNLPKLREMLRSSGLVQNALATDPEMAPMATILADDTLVTSGLGTVAVAVDGGIRRTTWGPSWMSGGAMSAGIVAAIAIPNMINAIHRSRQKWSLSEVRVVSTACEAFNLDEGRYPGPTDGWVHVDSIQDDLSPTYLATVPLTDAWDHPLLYWSDGTSCLVVSPGRDGQTSQDWRDVPDDDLPVIDADFDADLVMRNYEVIAAPEDIISD